MQNIYKHKAGSIDAQPTSVSSDTTSIVPALSFIMSNVMPIKNHVGYFAHVSGYIFKTGDAKEVVIPSFYKSYRRVFVRIKNMEYELIYLLIGAFNIEFKPTDNINYSITETGNIPINSIKIKSCQNINTSFSTKDEQGIIKYRCNEKASSANTRGRGILLPLEVYNCLVRHDFKCFYCWKPIVYNKWHLDHFVPIAKGGMNVSKNLVPSCPECNKMKSDLLYADFAKRCETIADIYNHFNK